METFSVGEIAVLISGIKARPEERHLEKLAGEDVEIISGLQIFFGMHSGYAYRVRTANVECLYVCPTSLRKKRPPQETTTWDRIEEITRWNPARQTA